MAFVLLDCCWWLTGRSAVRRHGGRGSRADDWPTKICGSINVRPLGGMPSIRASTSATAAPAMASNGWRIDVIVTSTSSVAVPSKPTTATSAGTSMPARDEHPHDAQGHLVVGGKDAVGPQLGELFAGGDTAQATEVAWHDELLVNRSVHAAHGRAGSPRDATSRRRDRADR